MWARDLSGIGSPVSVSGNISGVFDLAVNDWAERTHTKRNIEPLRFSHILWYKTLIR